MPKQNDLILTLLANPQFTTEDFQKVGLSANNTSLEDENIYTNSETITSNPLFQNKSGEFDKTKFHSVYVGASKMMQDLSNTTQNPKTVYSKYNIWAPVSQRDMSPQFELVKSANPDRITKSMIVFGRSGDRDKTPQEIAQSQQTFNSDTGEWMDSPEDLFSFKKLFNDPVGFFTDNFDTNKVLAQYDEDIDINGYKRGDANFNENLIEHYKGEYKLNENGTYYYRTLKDGENIHGKQLLHYSDILTREGSALNAIDFLDSDDLEKSTFGTFVKDASLIGAMFIPGGIGTAIAGATIFQQAAGLGATLGKIALQDSNNATLNWIEGLAESTNPMVTRSEYSSGDKMWTTENLLGMVADVVGQLYQQRLIFKWAPAITKGKWGISEEAQTALKEKYMAEIAAKNKTSLDAIIAKYGAQSTQTLKASKELLAQSQLEAASMVEDFMKGYYKSGEQLSKAYMTILTVNDIYSEAKEAGATDFDASVITAGYAAMEYALLSTDIGKWVLPELRGERLQNKALVRALTKDTLETFKKLGADATTNEAAKRTYLQKLVDFGKSVAKGEFNAGLGKRAAFDADSGLLKAGVGSLIAGASAEAIEETSEEVLADFSRVLFNGLQKLKGSDVRMQKPWEDDHLFDRYAMSFLGGFIGGGVSSAAFDFSQARKTLNMDYNKAIQEVIWKARNNDLDGIYKILEREEIGDKNLSATKFVEDENGQKIWKQGTESDNQDKAVKSIIKRQIKMLQDTLDAHGGNMSDEHLINQQTLKDIRFRALQNSTTAGIYIQKYNQTLGQLIEKTSELKALDSPTAKAERGESDKKDSESQEIKQKRSKLEKEIKELDEKIERFTSGQLAPLFMTSALLESTPFISEVFMRSSFKTYAENKAKTKFKNIPEGELKEYWNQYQEYLRTTKKDELEFAVEGYLSLQKLISQNFEEAKKVAEATANDETVKSLLHNHTLSTTKLNILDIDDDVWQENFQKFVSENPLTEKFITGIQLIRNTAKEAKLNADKKFEEDKALYDQQLANGEIEESVHQSYIAGLQKVKEDVYAQANRGFDNAIADMNFDIMVEQANQLSDNFINLGFINGAIKDTVISKLQESINTLQDHYIELQELLDTIDSDKQDELIDKYNKLGSQIAELNNKLEQVKQLKYTPILQNLDQFALNLKYASVSQILEFLGNAIQTNKNNIGAFTFGQDIHHAINEAERVIDLYIAALEGARTDTVDPFKVNSSTGNTEENLWGINKVLNEVHAKAPRIENDIWEDLPEIDGDTANMMLMDARSIKSLLQSYKKLFNINRGQKLEIQSRVGARISYVLYTKLSRLLTNADFPKNYKGYEELQNAIDNLKFFNDNVKDVQPKDWNINLSVDQQIALEKDRIAMETAVYEFFNKNIDKDWTEIFNPLIFNMSDSSTTLLNEGTEDIDTSSFIGYLISKIAINTNDFYYKYIDLIEQGNKKIAPLLGQEIGAQLHLGNILNGSIVTKAAQAYRNALYKYLKNADFETRKKFLMQGGESERAAILMSTQRGFERILASHDLIPQYSNITFTDGIAGSGKTSAIMATVIKFLQKYYPDNFNRIWTAHGGDSDGEVTFAEGLRKAIGLEEDGSVTFNKTKLMEQITPDRDLKTDASGKVYEFQNTDYKFINGKLVPNWKLLTYSKEELPQIIIIDEAQQLTQLELLTIDKFARENNIAVVMSGDLQQSQMTGVFSLSKEDISEINKELRTKNIETFDSEVNGTLHLARNQVIHTPKIGTSMRTENNQKNMNASTIQAVMETGQGDIKLHHYIDEKDIAGDYWDLRVSDEVFQILDKMIENLAEGEKINFAYSSEDSEVYKKLKENSKYWDKINPIKGVALGQEGNYWILDIDATQNKQSYLQDLYTGITRAKKASILISPKSPATNITLNNVQDSESHPETYSQKAIEKAIDKRIQVLKAAVQKGQDIPYNPRGNSEPEVESSTTPETPPTPTTPPVNSVVPTHNDKKNTFLNGIEKSLSNQQIVAVLKAATEANINGEITDAEFAEINEAAEQKLKKLNKRTDEEKVIQEGIQAVGEGIAESSESFTEQRIIDFLKQKDIEDDFRKNFGVGVSSIEEAIQRAINAVSNNSEIDEDTKKTILRLLNSILTFDSTKNILQSYITPREETNPEADIPPVIEEVQPEDIEEETESNEKETKASLSEENVNNDSESFGKIEVFGLDKKNFNFFLFSNATFELGITPDLINPDGSINADVLNKYRIDSVNGLAKIFGIEDALTKVDSEKFLAYIRKLLMSVEDKSELEVLVGNVINTELERLNKPTRENIYIRYAIKTCESKKVNYEYDKAQKDLSAERLPYARAQVEPQSVSNFANNRSLVAIIGDTEDFLEIPLLTLNNPLTIIKQKVDGQYLYPDVYNTYRDAYDQAYANADSSIQDKVGYSQIAGLNAIVDTYTSDNYKGLTNLIRTYLDTHRKISFIKDPNWTIGKNLHTFGPQMNISRGQKDNYDKEDYIQEDRWISLDEFRKDPQLTVSGIYHFADKSGEIQDDNGNMVQVVSKAKHPFILYTDALYAHDEETELTSDETLIMEYVYQKLHPEVKQTIKLAYVLPPKFKLEEYIESLIKFMTEGSKKGVLGNQRTPFKVLEGLYYDANGNLNTELVQAFKSALGEETGQLVYDKVKGIIDELKGKSFAEQIQRLTNDTPQVWNINGFGLRTEVQLYQHLQNVIKSLVQPASVDIFGNIRHKGSSDERASRLENISRIFEKSGMSLFYQTKGSKDQDNIILQRFSPIQEVDENGNNIENDYLSEKGFTINANLSSSTFMADEAFNDIIENMLNEYVSGNKYVTPTPDGRSYFSYNYSGFNPKNQEPSIHPDIINKLTKAGLIHILSDFPIRPTVVNDNSIELKNQIANAINGYKTSVVAVVLPNGELLIGKNELFNGKNVQFSMDENPFENGQNYQFDVTIDGEHFDVVYSDTNSGRVLEMVSSNPAQEVSNEYGIVDANSINVDRAKELLNLLADTSGPLKTKIQRILLTESDKLAQAIADLLNHPMTKKLIKIKNLDITSFADILNLEQNPSQDSCNMSIKIQLI